MPWFKVDDTFPHHAKVMAAGNGAIGLWTRAGAWSMQQLTDGHIPRHVARTLGTPAEARRLVDAGLWFETDDGYAFHQWGERQPTREQVEADRHAARERQRKARETAKSRRESRRDSQRSSDVSHGPPDPTRPDPTRTSSGSTPSDGDGKPRPTRATRLPDDWQPNDTHAGMATETGIDIKAEAAHFRDHHTARGSTMKDWDAAFRTWLRNATKFGRTSTQPTAQSSNRSAWAGFEIIRDGTGTEATQ